MGGKADLLNQMCWAAGDAGLGTTMNTMITAINDLHLRLTNVCSVIKNGTNAASLTTLIATTLQPMAADIATL